MPRSQLTKRAESLFGKGAKKKETRVYLNAENFENGLSEKEIQILKENGRFFRCPDHIPEHTKF